MSKFNYFHVLQGKNGNDWDHVTYGSKSILEKLLNDKDVLKDSFGYSEYRIIERRTRNYTIENLYQMSDQEFNKLSPDEISGFLDAFGIDHPEFVKKALDRIRVKES